MTWMRMNCGVRNVFRKLRSATRSMSLRVFMSRNLLEDARVLLPGCQVQKHLVESRAPQSDLLDRNPGAQQPPECLVEFGWIAYRDHDLVAVGANLAGGNRLQRSEEHTSELQSRGHLVCRLLLEK